MAAATGGATGLAPSYPTAQTGGFGQHAFSRIVHWMPWIASILSCLVLVVALPRIDFHADEAIYLQGIPLNVSNDSGLVFHLSYLMTANGLPTPISARWTSLFYGVILLVSLTRTLMVLLPQRRALIATVVPLTLMISYQGIFSILRVRPEISWFAIASVACWSLAELRRKDSRVFQAILIAALFLLPMNHILSWFACFVIGIYICCFARAWLGTWRSLAAIVAMACGLVANQAVRSWLINGQPIFLPNIGSQSPGARPSVREFLWNVFWNSPNFLNDTALSENLWQRLWHTDKAALLSHCMIATVIWGLALPLPCFMKSRESRFLAAVPALILVLFYLSGYYNPTYAPLLVIYSVALFVFVALDPAQAKYRRLAAGTVLLVSLLNGASFLTTRILNHGPATFFAVETSIRAKLRDLPPQASIAVAERFQSVVNGHPGKKYILFKDKLPDDVDYIVLDNYDFDMYRFVPDYDLKRAQLEGFLGEFASAMRFTEPVYQGDAIKPEAAANESTAATQGSWFFRNSVNYRVSVLTASSDADSLSVRYPGPSDLER